MTPSIDLLRPEIKSDVTSKISAAKELAAKRYDLSKRTLPALKVGEKVLVQDPVTHLWSPSEVLQDLGHRSFKVSTPSGSVRRNRVQVRPNSALPEASPELRPTTRVAASEPRAEVQVNNNETKIDQPNFDDIDNIHEGNSRPIRVRNKPSRLGIDG